MFSMASTRNGSVRLMTAALSQHRNAWSGKWDVMTTPTPRRASAHICASTRIWLPKSRLDVGSSIMRNAGFCMRARAMSTI